MTQPSFLATYNKIKLPVVLYKKIYDCEILFVTWLKDPYIWKMRSYTEIIDDVRINVAYAVGENIITLSRYHQPSTLQKIFYVEQLDNKMCDVTFQKGNNIFSLEKKETNTSIYLRYQLRISGKISAQYIISHIGIVRIQ